MNRAKHVLLSLAGGALLLCAAGCGETVVASASDPNRARETLQTVLSSWKSGEAHDAPTRRNPAIHVADEDWLAGTALVDFKIDETAQSEQVGTAVQVAARLTVRDARNKNNTRDVVYRVQTDPVLSVIRQD